MHFSHRIQFQTKKVWFIWKKCKKIKFLKNFFQNFFWPVVFDWKFFKFVKKISKLSCSIFWKGFENKSHQRRAHYLKPLRNGGPIPTGGLKEPLFALIRVKAWKFLQTLNPFLSFSSINNMAVQNCDSYESRLKNFGRSISGEEENCNKLRRPLSPQMEDEFR